MTERRSDDGEGLRDWVALVLAVALGLAVNLLMFAVLWDALRSDTPGLSENATQIVTTAFGGILGVLGSYLGFRAASSSNRAEQQHQLDMAEVEASTQDPPRGAPSAPGTTIPPAAPRDPGSPTSDPLADPPD